MKYFSAILETGECHEAAHQIIIVASNQELPQEVQWLLTNEKLDLELPQEVQWLLTNEKLDLELPQEVQ